MKWQQLRSYQCAEQSHRHLQEGTHTACIKPPETERNCSELHCNPDVSIYNWSNDYWRYGGEIVVYVMFGHVRVYRVH